MQGPEDREEQVVEEEDTESLDVVKEFEREQAAQAEQATEQAEQATEQAEQAEQVAEEAGQQAEQTSERTAEQAAESELREGN